MSQLLRQHTVERGIKMKKTSHFIALDAMRGLAAIVIAFGHFFGAFAPQFNGLDYQNRTGVGVAGTPLYAIFNGSAAVIFFFVLSGFVLSVKPLRTESYGALAKSALKRWPRLAGPVLVSCVASACIGLMSWYDSTYEAARLSGSRWFQGFSFNFFGHGPRIFDAVWEGLLTFFTGTFEYNVVLWTMRVEFLGSFLVFGFVAFLIPMKSPLLRFCLLFAGWLAVMFYKPLYSCFLVGAMLSVFHVAKEAPELEDNWKTRLVALAAFAVAVVIWGYTGPYKLYEFVGALFADTPTSQTLVYTVAAILLMFLGLYVSVVRNALSNRAGVALGQFSFPIYLVHILVICSLSSWLYVKLYGVLSQFWLVTVVLAVTAIAVAASVWVLSRIDRKITYGLDRLIGPLFTQKRDAAGSQASFSKII
ncbi:acyltransferase family protein [Brucella inopinata]|uniref:Acyltransferase n=1 Tax=Brucella inopinata TaxID=1218315 RepID=A0AAW7B166_9HYPH|nr:acyltransferase [Brucella inopinata]MDL2331886.1 acyltransferase [Brucella inopinata]